MADSDTSSVDPITELREKMIDKFLILTDGDYKMAKNLEISCFNASLAFANEKGFLKKWDNPVFKNTYVHKCISIFTNLDPNSYVKNEKLLERIKSGEIKAYELANLKPQEMYPEHWKTIQEQKERKDKLAYEIRTEHTVKGMYTCKRCKGDQVIYYQLQLRSSDEPMTTKITCANCGNRWSN